MKSHILIYIHRKPLIQQISQVMDQNAYGQSDWRNF